MNFECLDFLAGEGLSLIMTPTGERIDFVKHQIEYFTLETKDRIPSNISIPKTTMFFQGSKVLGYRNTAAWVKYYTKGKVVYKNVMKRKGKQG